MNKELTQEDLNNILVLISKTPITGNEAITVAVLQQKIKGLLVPTPQKDGDTKK